MKRIANLDPAAGLSQWRAAHIIAYATAQIHDVRATLWTFSSLSVIVMAAYALVKVL